jgi:hypothetical protein
VSLDTQARKLQENLEVIKADLTTDFTMVGIEVQTTKKEAFSQQHILEDKIEANKCDFQARLEVVEAKTLRRSRPTVGVSSVQPPTFNGNTSWSVFRRQFEIIADHNQWSERGKATYLLTALKCRAADMLYGIPTSTTYEDTFQSIQDRFGDQNFAAAYRCQLTRTQKAGESLQDFARASEQLAHCAYPTLTEDHIRREAGKAFSYWVRDPDIKIQLQLGGEKTVSEALMKALELHGVMVDAIPHQNTHKTYPGTRSPLARRKDAKQAVRFSCGEPGHFESSYDGYPHQKRDGKLERDKGESQRRPE